jgi:hypothetical protein
VVNGVRKACQGRPVDEDALALLASRVEDTLRAAGSPEVPADEVGLAILEPLKELDVVAYLRFASVYRAFESLADFEAEITALRAGTPALTPLAPQTNAAPPAVVAPLRDDWRTGMTETVSDTPRQTRGERKPRLRIERVYTTPGVHPVRRGHVGASRRRHDQLARRHGQLRAARRRVPRLLVGQRRQHRHHQVLPRRRRHPAARDDAAPAHRPGRPEVRRRRPRARLLRHEDDAVLFEHELTWMLLHQVFSFNSPVWFNVGTTAPQQVSACQPYDALVSTPPARFRSASSSRTTPSAPRSSTPTA